MECETSSSPAEARLISNQDTGNHHRRTVAAVRRTYECSFCKRGFTNAQALGGHMNIHRRDRVRAKQNSATMTPTQYCSSEESSEHFYYRNPKTYDNRQICVVSDPFLVRRCFLQASASGSPKLVDGDEEDVLSTSLSLRIGSSSERDENFGSWKKESLVEGDTNELDLELRLGS